MMRRIRQGQGTAAARIVTVVLGPQEDSTCRTERSRITVHGTGIIVLCQGPESWQFRRGVPVHRLMFPEPSPLSVRITVGVQIRVGQVYLDGRLVHSSLTRHLITTGGINDIRGSRAVI